MNYPVWQLDAFGGGLWIILIAVFHVYIAHFAVGGGLFIAVMETRVQRLGLTPLKDYLRRYAKFFLVFTMVVGGLTGVGIWFSASITAPGATSVLIHTFVLGWATEWTFFLAEIVTLLVYMRSFEAQRSTRRLILAWLYFVFAFGSLATVQGFISYMLTPGDWLTTQRFWDGFFNPTYWPGLAFRTCVCAILAGIFGLLTAQGVEDADQRKRLTRFCALWTILPLPLAGLSGWWHIAVLPPAQKALALGGNPENAWGMQVFLWAGPVVLAGAALACVRLPRLGARVVAVVALAASFMFLGSFEYMREAGRRPFLVTGYIYSNGIRVSQVEAANRDGVLATARFSRVKTITPENRMQAGEELYFLECSSCHSLGGIMLDIKPRSAKYTAFGMESLLTGLGKVGRYMPPFVGTQEEKKALAAWLTEGLHGPAKPVAVTIPQLPDPPAPAFNDSSEYVLTVAADRGINMLADADGRWTLGVGPQNLTAQLIKRDPSPMLVTADIQVTYAVENGPSGNMRPGDKAFTAENIRATPYAKDGAFNPYPLVTVQAFDKDGKLLAQTSAVLPVSTELGCRNCHGGSWSHAVAGIAPDTARDVLKAHDRLSGTTLLASREPVNCRSCHATGGDGPMSLSASMHGLHAVYLAGRGAEACNTCHPTDPAGATRAFRDPHNAAGLDCTSCHGALEDHALSLLAGEAARNSASAKMLMALIPPRDVPKPQPRSPWINEPKCVSCHVDYGAPQSGQSFGPWSNGASDLFKNKRDDVGAMVCASCHGSAHAVYPANNPYGANRDNLQPLQYQKSAKALGGGKQCGVCHAMDMDTPAHHPGMGLE